jgi:membrane-associated protein
VARFVPIIRTFAPFVAGIGKMNFFRFATFSVSGGALWVTSITLAGYFFGGYKRVQDNFQLVVLAIIFISILPMIAHYFQSRRSRPALTLDAPARPAAVAGETP